MDDALRARLEFVEAIDALKSVERRNDLADGSRAENSAEHSWHAALMAAICAEHCDEPVDLCRVMLMLLVHDIVEVQAGDTYLYDADARGEQERKEQGLDPNLVAELYLNATKLESLYGLLVIKNGYLIAEDYFYAGSVEREGNNQSVTKSYTSALTGIALDQGCLSSVDQKMVDFFPELADQIRDPRKKQITIRQMLQMRAGYPWEESTTELSELLYTGFRPSNLVNVPLTSDPGTKHQYSNLTSHLLVIIVARACETDLKSFAQERLFSPLEARVGFGQRDWEGYYLGYAKSHVTARDMAKFGLMYLNEGLYDGRQIVPAEWVRDSLRTYSENAWRYRVGRNFRDVGYGYQW
jgi:hypothetical protein